MSSTWETTEPGPPGAEPETVLVGRIARSHGIAGAVVVELLSDNPQRFAPGALLRARREGGRAVELEVTASRLLGRRRVVRFAGVESRERAEELRDAWLEVPAAAVPPPAAGSYHLFELIGCRCFERDGGELGRLERLVEDGGGWLLGIVAGSDELLVPFVERFVVAFDRGARRLELDLPAGLRETCTSRS